MSASDGQGAMWAQLAPYLERLALGIAPILDQPVVRMPYAMPLSQSQVIPAGQSGTVLTPTDFQYNFEYPFEIYAIKFSQDPAHTYRDWRAAFIDGTFSRPLQKAQTTMIAQLVDDNTGKWTWQYPWVMRPKGGSFQVIVDNLDTVNPITIDVCFIGAQMVPR